jgi:hypothetical protein
MDSKKTSIFFRYDFLINDLKVLKIFERLYISVDEINIPLIAAHGHLNDRNEDES